MENDTQNAFVLDEFLSRLAAQLKTQREPLRDLFVGGGEVLPANHEFRHGGLVHYVIQQIEKPIISENPDDHCGQAELIAQVLPKVTPEQITMFAAQYFADTNVAKNPKLLWVREEEKAALTLVNAALTPPAPAPTLAKIEPEHEFVVAENLQHHPWRNFWAGWQQRRLNGALLNTLNKATNENPMLPKILSLVRRGANVNLQNNCGWTALHIAARNGTADMVRDILAHNPNVNLQNEDGWTALHIAARNGTPEMVQDLLAAGADPTIMTTVGRLKQDGPGQGYLAIELVKCNEKLTDAQKTEIRKMIDDAVAARENALRQNLAAGGNGGSQVAGLDGESPSITARQASPALCRQ